MIFLSQRSARVTNNLSSINSEIDFTSYVLTVRVQNKLNPTRPKLDPGVSLEFTYTSSIEELIREVVNQNYIYVGAKKLNKKVFKETYSVDTLVYEFSTGSSSLTEINKFIYLPASVAKADRRLFNKIPQLSTWNLNRNPIIEVSFPELSLIDSRAEFWDDYYTLTLTEDFFHPFQPNFYFTGKAVVLNRNVLYEYFDNGGFYGAKDALYLSNLRPTTLDFPLGQPLKDELAFDSSLIAYKEYYPSRGSVYFAGDFTGYVTTSRYSSIKYYLYKRRNSSVFLSSQPPDKGGSYAASLSLLTDSSHLEEVNQIESTSSIFPLVTSIAACPLNNSIQVAVAALPSQINPVNYSDSAKVNLSSTSEQQLQIVQFSGLNISSLLFDVAASVETDSILIDVDLNEATLPPETTLDPDNSIFRLGSYSVSQGNIYEQCLPYLEFVDEDELLSWIEGMSDWLDRFTSNQSPFIINKANNEPYIVKNNLDPNQLGRGGYFPPSSGTSEGQLTLVRASLLAYEETGDIVWKNRAISMLRAIEDVFYRGVSAPTDPDELWIPHWLVNVSPAFTSKGLVANSFLNYGYFTLTLTFTNGVAQIPSGSPNDGQLLSNVYTIYSTNGRLLWSNVYAPVVDGTTYSIDYWVSNYMLKGQNYRVFPNTEAVAGRPLEPTTDTPGKIKLITNFTGQLKVVYSAFSGPVIQENELFDAYPMWRGLAPNETNSAFDSLWWAYDVFELLQEHGAPSDLTKWITATEATKNTALKAAEVPNLTHFYKLSTNDKPFSYPGSQVIQSNNTNAYTASRVTNGALAGALRIDVPASPVGSFPSCEFQNYAVRANLRTGVSIYVQAAHTISTLVEVVLSTASEASDLSQLYRANWLLTGGVVWNTKNFHIEDFILWGDYLLWHPTMGDDPIYSYSGGGGSVALTREQITLVEDDKNLSPVVWRVELNAGTSGFAGAGLNLDGADTSRPPLLKYKLTGNALFRIRDGSGVNWDMQLTTSDWREVSFNWSSFTYGSFNTIPATSPNTVDPIQAIEFQPFAGSSCTLQLYWAAVNFTERPKVLQTPNTSYKASIVTRDKVNYSFYIGDFRPVGSPSDQLLYSPGVVPYTVNFIDGQRDAVVGLPYAGYQSPYHLAKWEQPSRLSQSLDFLFDAQKAYAAQNVNKTTGPFAPVFTWNYWDNGDFLSNGLNSFGWDGPDPNTHWEGYQHRALEATARAWYFDPTSTKAQLITMKFLDFLIYFFSNQEVKRPPTSYPEFVDPIAEYECPHAAALILRAAMYANLAGGNPNTTFTLIKICLDYLRSEYVTSGVMQGCFSKSQSSFVVGGITYQEFFGFWCSEIIESLSLLHKHRNSLILPSCNYQLQ